MTTSTETLPYPRFSDAEMARRRDALAAELEAAGAAHAVLYGANKAGPAVGWLTRWPATREALCVFTPGERDLLLVNFYNHIPNAERIATEAEVRWAGPKPMATAIEELERRGARGERVAVIGPLGYRPYAALAEFASPVPLDDAYTRLRLRKSAEELDWLRVGCDFTDSAVRAVHEQAGAGHRRARAGQPGRARVRRTRRHDPHPLLRGPRPRPVAGGAHARARGRPELRDQRLVLGLHRPAAADVRRRGRPAPALPRAARRGGRGIRRAVRAGPPRRDGGGARRGLGA